jgi:hypothetical protein
MSDITANIVVQPIDLNVQVQQSEITVTPEVLGLNIYAGGFAAAAGNVGTVQYNNGGVLGGIPSVVWNGTRLSLGDTNNITISGGSPNYALRTDGAGNLSWGDTANANYANFAGNAVFANNAANANYANFAGNAVFANNAANANYANFAGNAVFANNAANAVFANNAANANIANIANVAYSVSAANVVGTVANANYAAFAGNVTIAAQSNITTVGNLTSLTVLGTSNLGNVGNVKVTGGTNGYFLQTDGTGNLDWSAGGGSGNGVVGGSNTQVQFNDAGIFGGSAAFVFNKTSNVMTLGGNISATNFIGNFANGSSDITIPAANGNINFDVAGNANIVVVTGTGANIAGTLNVTGNVTAGNVASTPIASMPYGSEKVGIIGAQTGTYDFDLITNSIQYSNANAAANLTLNFRGNSTTTLSSILGTGNSITGTYLITTGATAYGVTAVQVDGSAQTIKWAGNISTIYSNTISSYTFTVVKTSASPTYLVFGSVTKYG